MVEMSLKVEVLQKAMMHDEVAAVSSVVKVTGAG